MENEIWKPISGFQAYEVSSLGRVRRSAPYTDPCRVHIAVPVVLKHGIDLNGYHHVTLRKDGRSHTCKVHRLVMECFLGMPPTKKHQVAHWDGNKANNCCDNLRWATASENALDKSRLGVGVGSKNHQSKLTEADVACILAETKKGTRGVRLAEKFGVSETIIYRIKRRKIWQHVSL